ncbi:hypothetical protein [Marinitenerispora sediminis]|nr:hypothetical protein [Marinitenerispora sediminis]
MRNALRRTGAAAAVLLFTLLPSGIAFGLGVTEAPPAFAASRGQGTPGTFTAVRQECDSTRGGPVCEWHGTFTSADGTVRIADAAVGADTGVEAAGDRAELLLNGGRLHREGTGEWRTWAFWGVLGAAGLAAHAALAVRWTLRRMRGRRSGAPAGPAR